MTPSLIIELENISKLFEPETPVISDINIKIYRGELVVLLGTSGSGKSTLLNILGLLETPSSGKYRLDGIDTSGTTAGEKDRLRRDKIGFIFQSSNMLLERDTLENASLGLRTQGVAYSERIEHTGEILAELGLEDRLTTATKNLSGGEKQRCAIARAVATKPEIILADEPTGNLDSANSARVMKILQELNRAGHTIILVTHDPDVAAIASRTISIENGRLKEHTEIEAHPPAPRPHQNRLNQKQGSQGRAEPTASKRTQIIDDWLEIFSSLMLRPLRTLLLALSFALGIGGLVLATGISSSAAQHINTILLESENTTIRSGFKDSRELLHPHQENAFTYNQKLKELNHVQDSYYSASLAPTDVHISRFNPHEAEPATAIGLLTISASYLTDKQATINPKAALNIANRMEWQLESRGSAASVEGVLVSQTAAQALGLTTANSKELPQGLSIWVNQQRFPVEGIIDSEELEKEFGSFVLAPPQALSASEAVEVRFHTRVEAGYTQAVSQVIPAALAPEAPGSVGLETPSSIAHLRAEISSDLSIFLAVLSFILLLLAMFSSATAMYLSVQSRTAEIALRRAIGAGKLAVARLFLGEGITLGAIGGAVGSALGSLATVILASSRAWEPVLDNKLTGLALLLGVITGFLAASYPAWQASKKNPALAMRD